MSVITHREWSTDDFYTVGFVYMLNGTSQGSLHMYVAAQNDPSLDLNDTYVHSNTAVSPLMAIAENAPNVVLNVAGERLPPFVSSSHIR